MGGLKLGGASLNPTITFQYFKSNFWSTLCFAKKLPLQIAKKCCWLCEIFDKANILRLEKCWFLTAAICPEHVIRRPGSTA